MQQALEKYTGESSLEGIFKRYLKKKIPELRDRDDFEVEFRRNSVTCSTCGTENSAHGFFYRFDGSDQWIYEGGKSDCDDCKSRESFRLYMEQSKRERRKLLSSRLAEEYLCIPDTLKTAGFKNYKVLDSVTGKAKENAMKYVKDFLAGDRYNLLMQGNPGTGKSHLCVAIARTLNEHGYIVGFITTGELLRKIKNTWEKGASKTEEDIFRDLKRFDLLILDDLGSESIGGNDDWRKAMLFEIVNSRLGKPTVYTSNLQDTELPMAVGSRVHSRLYDNTKFIDLFTEDYRKKLMRA